VQAVEMTLLSRVTAPVCAKALPHGIIAVVFRVILSSARMLPKLPDLPWKVSDPRHS
jgi:hypothetical protein